MLEFECYGTDSQSIHIQGKTLINRAMELPVDKVEEEPEPEPTREYAVKFYANGGSFPGTDKDVITRIYKDGQMVGNFPEVAGSSELLGWYTRQDDGAGDRVFANTPIKDNMTFYAHWVPHN